MKSLIFFGLIYVILLPIIAVACDKTDTTTPLATTTSPTENSPVMAISLDDFQAENHMAKTIELTHPATLTLKLGANPTTGYEWADAVISSASVVQTSHLFKASQSDAVGSGGTDIFVFDSKKPGTATISISYGRPWEGGEKGTYTLTINVTVK